MAAPRLVPAAGYRATLRSVLVGPSVTPRIMRSPGILVFDSGVGGLTVFREIARARPDARFVYAADDALFPYGKVPRGRTGRTHRAADGRVDRYPQARNHHHCLQHRLDPRIARTCGRAWTCNSFHRHGAGDQAGLRGFGQAKCVSVLGTEATVKS